jgi:hypothetical protein
MGDVLGFADAAHHCVGSKTLLRTLPIARAAAAACQVGSDEARCYRVHSDVVRTKLHRKAFRQNRNFGLGRRIERIARQGSANRGNRAYVDNPALMPFPHTAHHCASRVDYSLDIDLAHACNLLGVIGV